jgi:HAD superfamily hydrolase (TIGR01490 family)
MRKVAFFDIDGTVFRSSLLIELCDSLVATGVFPADMSEEYIDKYQAWKNREGTYENYISALVSSYLKHIKGVAYGDLADVGRAVVNTHSKHVYRYTRDLINELRHENYYIVAISQSPKTILDEFCKQYGFDKVYGRMYELGPSDCFTGEMIDVHLIENKASIVSRVLKQDGLDPKGSIGVGDTEGDLSLLEAVDRPICFNPNQKLYEVAKKRDWPVVVERKDVIYHL